jgi:hypothetical protein
MIRNFSGYARALLAAVMIVVGLLLCTVAFAAVLGRPN